MDWRRAVQFCYQNPLRWLLRIVFRVGFGYRALGRENLPCSGAVILAANHLSYFDPILVAIGQERPLRFMTWSALFKYRIFAALIRSVGAFPVNLETWDVAAYRKALSCLKRGEWLVIFPEGRRSEKDELLPLRHGVAHLALRAGAKVVPVRIEGSDEAWPKDRILPRLFRRCRVRYGKAIDAPEAKGLSPEARHAAVERLLEAIRAGLNRPIE